MIWATPLAENLLKDGFVAMRKKWALKTVQVWLEKVGSNFTVVQMAAEERTGAMCTSVLASIRESLLL